MSMAQDSNFRAVRSDPPHSGDPARSGRANDPLAELARLIGQDDPFAGVSRPPSRAAAPYQPYMDDQQNAPEWLNRSGPRGPAVEHDAGYDQPAESPHYAAGYGDEAYQHDPRYQDAEGYAGEEYYDDGQYYADEGYEAPPKRRGLRTIAAVLGLALVGAGGVYGFRAWTSPATSSSEPPVIKADGTPTKIVPSAASASASDTQLASKPQYERVGGRGGERLVPREEQPVDPKKAAGAISPKAATGSVLPPLASAQPAAAPSGNEPRKVQTITIRPDQQMALAPASNPPQTVPAPAPPPAARAPAPAAAPAPASTRSVAIPPATEPKAGNYVVQVASQRSEADAQASFKSLQQKYPSVLGSYQAMIRRADLGDKGVYYRAQIGPFATAEQAKEVCSSLKSAGGQCIVQGN